MDIVDIGLVPKKIDVIEQFLVAHLSEQTRKAYDSDIRDFFGHSPTIDEMVSVQIADVVAWRNKMLESGMKAGTLNRKLTALNTLYSYAIGLGMLQLNPFHTKIVRRAKQQAWSPKLGLEEDHVKALLRACLADRNRGLALRDAAIIALGVTSLLRRGEIVSINMQDFRVDAGIMVLHLPKTKGGQDDKVPVIADVVAYIESYLVERAKVLGAERAFDPSLPLFIGFGNKNQGGRLTGNNIYRMIVRRAKEAGIDFKVNPHLMRHTGITQMLEDGHEARKVQLIARHKNFDTTQLYDRNRMKLKHSPSESLNRLINIKDDKT